MDPKTKQKTLRLLTNGMYVLTSRNAAGEPAASTVSWVSQASFKPPLIMAALRKDGRVLAYLRESSVAALHILGSDHRNLAQKFFGATRSARNPLKDEPFAEGKTSAPILKNIPAYIECKLVRVHDDDGDHAIAVLQVVNAVSDETVEPLAVSDTSWEYGG